MLRLKYHANFQIKWKSFAHRDQQKKTCLGYATINRRGDKYQASICRAVALSTSSEHTPMFGLIQK
jgi:hypothetical protein